MDKLRKEFLKERKMMADAMKTVLVERPKKATAVVPLPTQTQTHMKMTIDPDKLETTIKKACIPIQKRTITVLDTIPSQPVVTAAASAAASSSSKKIVTCKALNLNGTPCKFRAKKGHFCSKHAS